MTRDIGQPVVPKGEDGVVEFRCVESGRADDESGSGILHGTPRKLRNQYQSE